MSAPQVPDHAEKRRIAALYHDEDGTAYCIGCDVAPPSPCAVECVVASALSEATREGLEAACEAVREDCSMCGGKGYTETSHADHGCGGDERICGTVCPVERLEQEGCEYCGRPIEAIRRRLEKGKGEK